MPAAGPPEPLRRTVMRQLPPLSGAVRLLPPPAGTMAGADAHGRLTMRGDKVNGMGMDVGAGDSLSGPTGSCCRGTGIDRSTCSVEPSKPFDVDRIGHAKYTACTQYARSQDCNMTQHDRTGRVQP